MKKLILALAALPAFAANAQTVKKVMLEDYTGAWCQYCPNGAKAIEDLEAQYPNTFIAVASHNDNAPSVAGSADRLEIAEGDTVANGVDVGGYPNGAIDRKVISGGQIPMSINANGTQWKDAVADRLAVPAIASVAFANLRKGNDGMYEGDIIVKFNSAPAAGTPIKVNVYLLEDKIPAEGVTKQRNCTQWYGGPGAPPAIWTYTSSSTPKFYHDNTLRASLGGTWGWAGVVPATVVVGTEYKKHFTFKLADASTTPAPVPGPWVAANMEVVGFVAYDGTAAADKKEILNAEKVALSAFFPVGVAEVANNVSILDAYPNPVSASEIVNITYNIKESGKVSLKVLNAVGQVVATPFTSDEVAGAHTISWRPANNGLAAGVYVLQLSTANGSHSQRISIQ